MKISQLTEITQAVRDDYLPILDVSDTTQATTGSARKVQVKNISGQTIVVSPTGTNDDVLVQTALNALPSTGGKIYLTEGTFSFSNQVSRALSNVTIEGSGFGTIIKWANSANKVGSYLIQTNPYWQIKNLQIDGNKSNNTGGGGIDAYQSARLVLQNLYITSIKENSIHFKGTSANAASHAAQLSNVRILSGDGYGIFGESYSYDMELLNVWIGSCLTGARLQDGNIFASNLHIWGCTANGLELRSTNNRITNAYLETNGGNGANIFNAHSTSFVNCNIWKNGNNGISCSTSNRLRFVGSEAYNNNGAGIKVSDSLYWKIVANDFYDDQTPKKQTYGVQSTGSSDYGLLTDNAIRASDHLTGNYSLIGANSVTANNVT